MSSDIGTSEEEPMKDVTSLMMPVIGSSMFQSLSSLCPDFIFSITVIFPTLKKAGNYVTSREDMRLSQIRNDTYMFLYSCLYINRFS